MAQIINLSNYILGKQELQTIGIEAVYKESKEVLDEKAGLYLDMYGRNKLFIKGKAEELELYADTDVKKEQIIFKIGYYNRNNLNKEVLIDVPFNINIVKDAEKILEPETLGKVVVFVAALLYAIAVITRNSGLQRKTGSLAVREFAEIQKLYEEKIRKYLFP